MNYKEVIESRYNRQNWQLLLHDIFGSKIKFWNHPSSVQTSSPFAKQAFWLGTITLSDEQTIVVYEVELADSVDIERNRRGIRDMLLTTWRNNGNAGAFMFCYRKNESVLRFSYVSESWKFADDGSYQKESTDTRRFTYLLGEGHRSRTAIQQFEQLRDSGLSLKDLTKAFSVDAVSDMFFDGYKKQYENIIFYITGKRMVKVANKWEERLEGKPCQHIMQQFSRFPNPEKAIRDYVKKLMGRLVFLQFLQKKGWLGVGIHDEWGSGDPEFIQNLFKDCPNKDHFVNKVLNLLFNDLNTERKNDLSQLSTLNSQLIKIPYLNGGLFEREAADEMEFPLPAKYMQSLLDFFASYNFTIDENDPDDAEVGVDPEMLGRIFENLLEDNKDKGAFYTPKEIVSYMCRESLIAYLQTGFEDETTKEAIRQFVTTHQVQEHLPENTDQLLKDVKICDPAIGSGAFPMGLLKELFLCRTALEGISQHQAAEIKKHIIQQNVYGVDIERGAVDIARLRFWLSLIVDEETPQALPNLDFKIMQGNSLLEQYKGVDLSTITEKKADDTGMLTFFDDMIDVYRKEFRDMLSQYFDCTDHKEKQSLRIRIIENVKRQLREQHINVDFGDLDLSGNDQFFLWHTWFHDVFSKGGFDIVIGNPPYVNINTMPQMHEIFKKVYPEIHTGYNDLMYYFICQGIRLLSFNGIITFITSNYYLGNDYAKKLRVFLNDKIEMVINFHNATVFESASIHTAILFARKKSNTSKMKFYTFHKDKLNSLDLNNDYEICELERNSLSDTWIISNAKALQVIEKMKINSVLLGEITEIAKGSETGKNGIFSVQKDVLEKYNIESEIVRQCVKNSHVQKYVINKKDLWLIYCDNDFSKMKYPNAYAYLEGFKKELLDRRGPKSGEYEWWRLHRPSEKKVHDAKEKLIVPYRGEHNRFAYDDMQCFNDGGDIRAIAIKDNSSFSIKFLLGLLNSSLLDWFYGFIGKPKGKAREYFNKPLSEIPIPQTTKEQQQPIIVLVDQILSAKRSNPSFDTTSLESEIDKLIYQLYGLSYDEVLLVDPETPITREEYEG